MSSSLQAAIAAHRFGLGEAQLDKTVSDDARGWLAAQIGPADAQLPSAGAALPTATEGLRRFAEFVQQRKQRREAESMKDMSSTESQFGEHFRVLVQADTRARLTTAAVTQRPFAERLIGSIRGARLNHVLALSERHLRSILTGYLTYYHRTRTHLSLTKDAPDGRPGERPELGKVVPIPEVGGLHHRYVRRAA